MARSTDGKIYTFGWNDQGQLGTGDLLNKPKATVSKFSSGATVDIKGKSNAAKTVLLETQIGGFVSKVQFYDVNSLIGTDTSSPYTFSSANQTTGFHTYKAVATDLNGATVNSKTVLVEVLK